MKAKQPRRTLHWCARCMNAMYEVSAVLIQKGNGYVSPVCADCKKSDLTDEEYKALKKAQTGPYHRKVEKRRLRIIVAKVEHERNQKGSL